MTRYPQKHQEPQDLHLDSGKKREARGQLIDLKSYNSKICHSWSRESEMGHPEDSNTLEGLWPFNTGWVQRSSGMADRAYELMKLTLQASLPGQDPTLGRNN